jgi:hypothetical protein
VLVTLILTFRTSQRGVSTSVRISGLMERLLVVEVLLWFAAFGIYLARVHVSVADRSPARESDWPAGYTSP